jgi:Fur family transcriptional regulator, ferric uptake regulator
VALKTQSIILQSLGKLDKFSSAQEVYSQVLKGKNKIGLSTVYRTLQKLADAKEIDFLRRADGEGVYKVCINSHHHHLLCAKCGASDEFNSEEFESTLKKVAKQSGYMIQGHDIEIVGLCRNCR